MRSAIHVALLSLVLACLVGCGNMSIRRSQDWSEVQHPRFFRACQVGNWGSGVILEHTTSRMLVLTCAHLVEEGQSVAVYFVDPEQRAYSKVSGRVIHRSHPHKEDLALIEVTHCPAPSREIRTHIAPQFSEGEERTVDIVNVAMGAQERPFAFQGPLFRHVGRVSTVIPDEKGQTEWTIAKGLMHGGILQANSGSPIFDHERLVGLTETSPGLAARDGELHQGIITSLPETLRRFLKRCGHEASDQ